MSVQSKEEKVVVHGYVPPEVFDTLVFTDIFGDTSRTVLVETVQKLGENACQIGGTYLENDKLCYVEASVENTRRGANRTFGHAQFAEAVLKPTQQ